LATNGLTSGCPGTHRKPSKSNPTKMWVGSYLRWRWKIYWKVFH
jgi:hypothetical protein